jgi:RND family efflux transporter MFP subunit
MRLLIFFSISLLLEFSALADPFSVRVSKVKIYELYETYSSLGLLNKSQGRDYSVTIPGKVTYVIGQNIKLVKKGQNIISIDGDYAKSSLDSAKQTMSKAETDYNNNLKLFSDKLISKQSLEASKTASYKAKADFEAALKQYENLVFIAPFEGQIGSISQKIGDNVKAGDFLFSLIGESDNVIINFNISSSLIEKIDENSKVWIDIDKKLFGKIILISPYLSKQTGDFGVKVSFPNEPGLIQNQYYNASFDYNIHEGLVVPENSLLSSDKGSFIYIVSNNIVKKINVKIGVRLDGLVEIISTDIKPDDLVITEGLNKVFPNSQVKIIE